MTDKTIPDETEIDALFAEAARAAPVPSAQLLSRIVADAERIDDAARRRAVPPHRGPFANLMAALGGWPAVAGLATATVAGIWIGYASPDALNSLTDGTVAGATYELGDLIPSFDYTGQEG